MLLSAVFEFNLDIPMKYLGKLALLFVAGVMLAIAFPYMSYAQDTFTGVVEQVWEDGLRVNTGDRTFRIDSWDVYGDNTPDNVAMGDCVTVAGEFSGREFDAFSIDANEASLCESINSNVSVNSSVSNEVSDANAVPTASEAPAAPAGDAEGSFTGRVEAVWEDGLRLDTGNRTIRVDSWAVYGDNTPQNVAVGDCITMTGEFAGRTFDAFSISADESASCQS